MAEKWGLERLGFLTLTFADHVLDPAEAQRRFNSLATHVLSHRYPAWLRVFERQKSGRVHYHLLVVLEGDVRTGIDWSGLADRDYRSAGPVLRAEWAFWRSAAKRYGFGRTELLPIRSTVEAAAAYVGKYIGKHVQARQERDKGVRLVAYSSGACSARTRFSWACDGGQQWRAGVEALAVALSQSHGYPLAVIRRVGLSKVLGPRWGYEWRDAIMQLGALALSESAR